MVGVVITFSKPAEQAALTSTLEDLGEPGRERPLKEETR